MTPHDKREDELNVVAGAVMTVEKMLSVEGSSEVRNMCIKCKNRDVLP